MFPGCTLECSRDIQLPFQLHVYLRVQQLVLLALNLITEETVILLFLYAVQFAFE